MIMNFSGAPVSVRMFSVSFLISLVLARYTLKPNTKDFCLVVNRSSKNDRPSLWLYFVPERARRDGKTSRDWLHGISD